MNGYMGDSAPQQIWVSTWIQNSHLNVSSNLCPSKEKKNSKMFRFKKQKQNFKIQVITCSHFQMSISSLKAVSLVKNYNSIILMVGGDVHSKYITLIHSFLSNLILKSLHIIYKFQDVISLYHGLHNK